MTFTYVGDLATTLDKVRFEFGDTDSANAKFTDEEINYVISVEYSILNSVARLCEIYSTKCADASSRTMGPLRVELSARSKAYMERARDIRSRITKSAQPYFGGVYAADSEAMEDNTSLNQPIFDKGLMDNE